MFHEERRVTPIFAGVRFDLNPHPQHRRCGTRGRKTLVKRGTEAGKFALGDNGGSLGVGGVAHSQEWLCYGSSRICMDWSMVRVG
jgi:hypothetical protein